MNEKTLEEFMDIIEMKRIKTLLFQATNEKNASLISDYLADEIIWHECDENGKDAIFTGTKEKFINGNILGEGAFEKTKKIIFQVAENDMVVTYFAIEGTHANDFMGIHATGKHARFYATYTAKFVNGKISELWAICDGHLALKQIGAI
jgi:predicted ester cyclase